jgi:hypothetical protein
MPRRMVVLSMSYLFSKTLCQHCVYATGSKATMVSEHDVDITTFVSSGRSLDNVLSRTTEPTKQLLCQVTRVGA